MTACTGDFESSLGGLLTADILEVDYKVLGLA
jgi:hypothetical protein